MTTLTRIGRAPSDDRRNPQPSPTISISPLRAPFCPLHPAFAHFEAVAGWNRGREMLVVVEDEVVSLAQAVWTVRGCRRRRRLCRRCALPLISNSPGYATPATLTTSIPSGSCDQLVSPVSPSRLNLKANAFISPAPPIRHLIRLRPSRTPNREQCSRYSYKRFHNDKVVGWQLAVAVRRAIFFRFFSSSRSSSFAEYANT